ncbi:hypothetical protein E4P40_12745 [Blastococcus sp. CT_GayMR20]|uniref:hypothetical protein n=1 Tax=Blastococcus sp. CT_GayMR20 TaxID=2559609 RepID=UPI0010736A23|nr:hypothetical protein [Blastococcus sp. CT_GayMR20]TFV86503.1 hypothetical protein E4P40_12745 [Blastococcus sp. CT_GayMR20]
MGRFIASLLAVAVVLAVILILVLQSVPDDAVLSLEFAKALISLITAVLITGILGVVLAHHNADRARREDRARAFAGALQDLKAGYERVQVARFLLTANPSARTLMEQVSSFSEARGQLHKVQRTRFVHDTPVEDCVQDMLDAMNGTFDEYRENHAELLRDALAEERAEKAFLDGTTDRYPAVRTLSKDCFHALHLFLEDGEAWKQGPFHRAYSKAKKTLEDQLREEPAGVRSWFGALGRRLRRGRRPVLQE